MQILGIESLNCGFQTTQLIEELTRRISQEVSRTSFGHKNKGSMTQIRAADNYLVSSILSIFPVIRNKKYLCFNKETKINTYDRIKWLVLIAYSIC